MEEVAPIQKRRPQALVEERERAWREADEKRFEYDTNMTAINRIFKAVADFQDSRKLNHIDEPDLWDIWQQFSLFVGLVSDSPRHPQNTNKNTHYQRGNSRYSSQRRCNGSDHQSRRGNYNGMWRHQRGASSHSLSQRTPVNSRPNYYSPHSISDAPPPKHPYKYLYSDRKCNSDGEDEYSDNEELQAVSLSAADQRLTRLWAFLHDPERALKIFLSWAIIDMGSISIYHEPNLHATPWIISSFFKFLVRNRVLPEPEYADHVRRAGSFLSTPSRELPLTYQISQALPDPFSDLCIESWGSRSDGLEIKTDQKLFQVSLLEVDVLQAALNDWHDSSLSGWDKSGQLWDQGSFIDTLPLTHTTGAVEKSMRRIKTLIPQSLPLSSGDADLVMMLEDCGSTLAKVVLEQWVGWDQKEELSNPTTRSSVDDFVPHDITLLVEPASLETLCVGMGLEATWIQIIRRAGIKGPLDLNAAVDTGYWYMEHLSAVLPSYYAQGVKGKDFCAGLFEV